METITILSFIIGVLGLIPTIMYFIDLRQSKRISWKATLKHVEKIADKIKHDSWEPDIFLAFPKGGLIVADLLNHHFHCDYDIVTVHTKRTIGKYNEVVYIIRNPYTNLGILKDKKILIVDDVLENGVTLIKVIELLCKAKIPRENIKTAVLGRSNGVDPAIQPDYYAFDYIKSKDLYLPWGKVTL